MMATGDTQDPRQQFLNALTGAGGAQPLEAPTDTPEAADPTPPAPPPAPQPEPPPTDVPPEAATPAPAPVETAPAPSTAAGPAPAPAAPAWTPPAGGPAPPPAAAPLMDLGYDAQVQGTALGLRSIANRLQVIAEGLKLIPALQNIGQDLQSLGYGEVAQAVDALVGWAQSEEQALMTELEQRTAARQQPQPST